MTLRFGLPPSLGRGRARAQAAELQARLRVALDPAWDVYVAHTYSQLSLDVIAGHARVAWGPPLVCAQVELQGGRALLRAVRGGTSSYRAALVARADADLDLDHLAGKTAVWVDRESAAGFLLAAAALRRRGVDIGAAFAHTLFVGSYVGALEAVHKRLADVTSIYASIEGARFTTSALDEFPWPDTDDLRVLAYTDATPNDGLVTGPVLDADARAALRAGLLAALTGDGAPVLASVFNAEALAPAPAGGYQALHELAASLMRP